MQLIDVAKLVAMLQRLSQREKIILYLSVAAVLLVVADRLVLSPIHRNFQSLDQRINDTELNIKKSIRLLGQKEKMTKEAERYAVYTASSKSTEDGVMVLLWNIQDLASQTSVNLLYSKPAAADSKERNVYRITLECEGQVDQIISFFYAIENSKFLFRIEKYALQATAKGSSVIKCAATVSMARLS